MNFVNNYKVYIINGFSLQAYPHQTSSFIHTERVYYRNNVILKKYLQFYSMDGVGTSLIKLKY